MTSTAPHKPKIKRVFCKLTSNMLPKRKLNMSTVKPFARLIKITPIARPDESKIATVASLEIWNFCLIFVRANALETDTTNAAHSGYTPR